MWTPHLPMINSIHAYKSAMDSMCNPISGAKLRREETPSILRACLLASRLKIMWRTPSGPCCIVGIRGFRNPAMLFLVCVTSRLGCSMPYIENFSLFWPPIERNWQECPYQKLDVRNGMAKSQHPTRGVLANWAGERHLLPTELAEPAWCQLQWR